MLSRFARPLALALAVCAAAGCASTPSRFYTLDSTVTAGDPPAGSLTLVVGPITVPASVDRPQMVVQVAPNRVELDEFHRWAAPLNDSIGRVVAGDLSVLLGTPEVSTAGVVNFNPTYSVTIDVQRFESIPNESVLLEALWVVYASAGGPGRSGRTLARETVQGDGYEAIAAAHSRALAQLSADIAAAIRSAQAQR